MSKKHTIKGKLVDTKKAVNKGDMPMGGGGGRGGMGGRGRGAGRGSSRGGGGGGAWGGNSWGGRGASGGNSWGGKSNYFLTFCGNIFMSVSYMINSGWTE